MKGKSVLGLKIKFDSKVCANLQLTAHCTCINGNQFLKKPNKKKIGKKREIFSRAKAGRHGMGQNLGPGSVSCSKCITGADDEIGEDKRG